ncbi:MAG: hypothetical protein ABFD65_13790 [Candidatus Polarisedimenticolia bacterium]|nr:hypothetical protein [bacterium]
MAVQRNLDTEQARLFWACVDEGAKQYMALPEERRGVLGTRGAAAAGDKPACAEQQRPVGLTTTPRPSPAR